jgi:hypothetical protein
VQQQQQQQQQQINMYVLHNAAAAAATGPGDCGPPLALTHLSTAATYRDSGRHQEVATHVATTADSHQQQHFTYSSTAATAVQVYVWHNAVAAAGS